MRNPAQALSRVPNARATGEVIQAALERSIAADPDLLEPCRKRFRGEDTQGFSTRQVQSARDSVMAALGAPASEPQTQGISVTQNPSSLKHGGICGTSCRYDRLL